MVELTLSDYVCQRSPRVLAANSETLMNADRSIELMSLGMGRALPRFIGKSCSVAHRARACGPLSDVYGCARGSMES